MKTPEFVLVTLDYPPERGGVARYLGNLVAAAQGRIRVIVETKHDLSGPGVVEERQCFRTQWPTWWPLVGVIKSLKSKTNSDERPIVLVSHVFPVGTAACISRWFGGPAYAVLFHGLDLRRAHSLWKRWLLRWICSRASLLIANSESTKKELRTLVPRAAVTVLTPGVEKARIPTREEARRSLGLDPSQRLILSVARLIPRKGIDVTLQAVAQIQEQLDVAYVVVGDGPDRQRLEQIAQKSRARVRWIVDADDAEKWMWMAAADVFVLPVRDEGDDVEGFGIVYLEAAMAGVPAIAGKSGGAEEAVRNEFTGLLVAPTRVHDLQTAILRLLGDESLRLKLGWQARERAERDFRWEERWDKLKALTHKT